MLTGEYVRRAVGNVSSTISQASSSVTAAAQGKKRYDISDEAMEKCTLTVKCTPRKDAVTTSALSIKSGYLMKRNEQGQWVKRYVCTVPHLFLYYFDSDSAESPRGVIDLELYTNITQQKNTLKAATVHEEKMRSFHFMCDDEETLNNWLAHLLRDRYFGVCEERSAYHQMQSELTDLLDTMNSQMNAVKSEKETMEKQLQEAQRSNQEVMKILQNILVNMGITEEEMSQLNDIHRIGQSLQEGILRLKKDLDASLMHAHDALESQRVAHIEDISQLNEKLDAEIQTRKKLETLLSQEKKTSEMQLVECKSFLDAHLLEKQAMTAAKTETDEKNVTLTEQRKVLVKEVKRTRAKLAETETSLEQLGEINHKLTAMVIALQAELKATKALCEASTLDPPFVPLEDVEQLLLESDEIVSKIEPVQNSEASDRLRRQSGASEDSPSAAMKRNSPFDLSEFGASGRLPSSDLMSGGFSGSVGSSVSVNGSANQSAAAVGSTSTASTAAAPASSTFSMFSNTFSRISATIHSPTASAPSSSNHTSTVPAHIAVADDNHFHPDKKTGEKRRASTKQMHCLRCSGTVEGPQFSTCKCATPALVAEDLSTDSNTTGKSSWGFGNLLSKSSSAFVGGLNKLTAKEKDPGKDLQSHNSSGNGGEGMSEGTEHSEKEKAVDNLGSEKTHSERTHSEVDLTLPAVAEDEEETADNQGEAQISGDDGVNSSGSSTSSAPLTPATEVPPAPESPQVAPEENGTANREQTEETKPLSEEKTVDEVAIIAE